MHLLSTYCVQDTEPGAGDQPQTSRFGPFLEARREFLSRHYIIVVTVCVTMRPGEGT